MIKNIGIIGLGSIGCRHLRLARELRLDLKIVAVRSGKGKHNKEGNLKRISEKPSYDQLVNTGLYILNPSILDLIPHDKFYHITNLINDLIKNNYKVGVFPIDDDAWIDIGEWSEYKKALVKL